MERLQPLVFPPLLPLACAPFAERVYSHDQLRANPSAQNVVPAKAWKTICLSTALRGYWLGAVHVRHLARLLDVPIIIILAVKSGNYCQMRYPDPYLSSHTAPTISRNVLTLEQRVVPQFAGVSLKAVTLDSRCVSCQQITVSGKGVQITLTASGASDASPRMICSRGVSGMTQNVMILTKTAVPRRISQAKQTWHNAWMTLCPCHYHVQHVKCPAKIAWMVLGVMDAFHPPQGKRTIYQSRVRTRMLARLYAIVDRRRQHMVLHRLQRHRALRPGHPTAHPAHRRHSARRKHAQGRPRQSRARRHRR